MRIGLRHAAVWLLLWCTVLAVAAASFAEWDTGTTLLATIALFIVLGGGAYVAGLIGRRRR
jgi:hypothetical protein